MNNSKVVSCIEVSKNGRQEKRFQKITTAGNQPKILKSNEIYCSNRTKTGCRTEITITAVAVQKKRAALANEKVKIHSLDNVI